MSKDVSHYVDLYIKSQHDKIRRVCEPLKNHFGINYFTYHSIGFDGTWRPIVSRPDWADFYTEEKLYNHDPFILHPRCYEPGAIYWAQHMQTPFQQKILEVAKEKFDMSHGFVIVERSSTGFEFFGFSAPFNHQQIYSTYLNDQFLLKKFCRYFKQEVTPILKKVYQNPIDIQRLKGDSFINAHTSPFTTNNSSVSFLKQIRSDLPFELSKRERQVFNYYLEYTRMQDVADNLDLSIRTVESYLSSIKNKLSCFSKADLLRKGQELKSLGFLP